MTAKQWISLGIVGVAAVVAVLSFLKLRAGKKKTAGETLTKKQRRGRTLTTVLFVVSLWAVATQGLGLLFGPAESESLEVVLAAPRVTLFGLSVSSTMIGTWVIIAVAAVFAVCVRLFLVPRLTEVPHGLQNVLEIAIEQINRYTNSLTGGLGEALPAYIFSIAFLFLGSALVELFGVRAPMVDFTMTFGLALCTFFLINFYGIKRKGIGGRIRSLAQPNAAVMPIKMVTDIAIPVSMACRLFGNMLGGMIVMDLLYMAMGGSAIGVPSVVGLYFNVFHPLIQAFIFVTLTLTFINEAAE